MVKSLNLGKMQTQTRYFSEVKDLEALKKAYRSWALKLHPDRGGNEEAFKEMKEEYDALQGYLSTFKYFKNKVRIFEEKWEVMTWRTTRNGNYKASIGNVDLLIFKRGYFWKGLITIAETDKNWLWEDYETVTEVKKAIFNKIRNSIILENAN